MQPTSKDLPHVVRKPGLLLITTYYSLLAIYSIYSNAPHLVWKPKRSL